MTLRSLALVWLAGLSGVAAQTNPLELVHDYDYLNHTSTERTAFVTSGLRAANRPLEFNGEPFLMRGATYSPAPIGVDVSSAASSFDFYTPASEAIWRRDLPLMREMGMNTLRVYTLEQSTQHTAFLDLAHALNITVLAGFPLHRDIHHLRIAADLQATLSSQPTNPGGRGSRARSGWEA